ncbi:hypothetical protein [Thiofilum flexile]|uniref:hypothetical protein n=1 Tax=Thiofilum flexile TaxID=125627 RepID=UPI00036D21F4|nr:hypothetical protein [Thiofilum flexile]
MTFSLINSLAGKGNTSGTSFLNSADYLPTVAYSGTNSPFSSGMSHLGTLSSPVGNIATGLLNSIGLGSSVAYPVMTGGEYYTTEPAIAYEVSAEDSPLYYVADESYEVVDDHNDDSESDSIFDSIVDGVVQGGLQSLAGSLLDKVGLDLLFSDEDGVYSDGIDGVYVEEDDGLSGLFGGILGSFLNKI